MALFESYERRIDKINSVLNSYGIASIEEAEKITKDAGLNVYDQIKGIQPICFENACWAYTVGAAIAIKKECKKAADAAAAIGEGLQAFCIPGSVADTRKVGLGHGNLGKMLLEEETECFCFLAGHESFAAAEGAIGIAEKANKVRQKPLRVILNGLGKDAAQIISRINGFTYVETEYDPYKNEVKEVFRKAYSEGLRAKVNCYGANSVPEGVAIMWKENVMFQANVRRDGSSRFAKNYRWGTFPSFSASWVMSEEPFMQKANLPWLSYLKLRASWGKLGNERIGSNYFPYIALMNFGSTLFYMADGSVVSGSTARPAVLAVEDITWETTTSTDLGFDANFLNNRLHINFDYYYLLAELI